MWPFVPDDSYISFRYAEHLSDGQGLRFNVQDGPVEGYSNFLWIVFCAILDRMGLPLPAVAPVFGVLLGILTLAMLWLLYVRSRVPPLQMFVPLILVATAGPFVIYTVSGLETAAFAFLLLLTLLAYQRCCDGGRVLDYLGLAFVGFLTAICRPEGVLALPALLALVLIAGDKQHRKAALMSAATFVILYAAYTIWRVSYFHGFWPTPFLSKGRGAEMALAWIKNLSQYFVMQGYEFPPLGYYFAAITVLAVIGLRAMKEKSRCGIEMAALVLGIVYVVVYFNFVDWMPGMRYHAALLPLFFVPMVHMQRAFFERGIVRSRVFAAVMVALLLINLSVLMQLRLTSSRIERGNQACLVALAEWIRTYTPADWKIAISDVGAVPYYSGRHTIDINPESLTDRYIAQKGWDEEYVFAQRPEIVIVVARGVFSPKMYPEHFAWLKTPRFAAMYRFIGTVRYFWFEDRSYWVYFPKNSPRLSDAAFDAFPAGIGSMRRVEH